jgi:hypothetical protein
VNHVQVGGLGVHGQLWAWLRLPRGRERLGERMASIEGLMVVNKWFGWFGDRGLSRSMTAQALPLGRGIFSNSRGRAVRKQVGRSETGASRCIPAQWAHATNHRPTENANPPQHACHASPQAPKGGKADQASTHPSCRVLHVQQSVRSEEHPWCIPRRVSRIPRGQTHARTMLRRLGSEHASPIRTSTMASLTDFSCSRIVLAGHFGPLRGGEGLLSVD